MHSYLLQILYLSNWCNYDIYSHFLLYNSIDNKVVSMSSFQLVNHQLKHMFGGIEAQKNSSLQYLQVCQKKIAKSMERAQANHMKIYQAIVIIKTSLTELSDNYLSLSKENKHSGGLISKLTFEVTNFLQDVSEESLSLSKKMESKVESYVPNLKKIKEKYTDCAETLEHYRKKVGLLQKSVQKQSLANIKQDQHERFQRNKQKLRIAEKEHDQILMKTTKRFIEFNSEGMKDVYNDLVSVFTTIGGNIMQISMNLTKHLCDNFSSHEALLSKQLKIKKDSDKLSVEEAGKGKKESTGDWLKGQTTQTRKALFEHLTQQRQISNYLRKIIEKQMVRLESEKIQQAFKAKNSKIATEQRESNVISTFNHFQNIYNNHELKHHHHHHPHNLLEKLKEEDPIQACEDLLEIDEPTEISRAASDEISKYQIQCSFESSPQNPKIVNQKGAHQKGNFEERMKKNLQKFNNMCQRQKSPTPHISKLEKAISPSIKAIESYKYQNNNYCTTKTTVLKSPQQFFNMNYFEDPKKQEKPKDPQEQLLGMHEHLFNFNLLEPKPKPNFSKPNSNSKQTNSNPSRNVSSIIPNSQSKPTEPVLSFDNFDFLIKQSKLNPQTKSSVEQKTTGPLTAKGNFTNLLNL